MMTWSAWPNDQPAATEVQRTQNILEQGGPDTHCMTSTSGIKSFDLSGGNVLARPAMGGCTASKSA